jgi:hypothetical protein
MNSSKVAYVGIDLLPLGARGNGPSQEPRQHPAAAVSEEQGSFLAQPESQPRHSGRSAQSSDELSYIALDGDLHLLAIGRGRLADALAYVSGQISAFVAINAPRRPALGLMRQESVRQSLEPPPKPGSWLKYRVAEYQLRLPILPTPNDISACPGWMRRGFDLYSRLETLGYSAYPAGSDCPRQSLEVQAYATYTGLLGQAPFPSDTLEGRLQRQLILHELGVRVADPMDFFEDVTPHRLLRGILPLKDIHTPDELDALAAAYTAWLAAQRAQQVNLLGAPEEGQIVVPQQGLLDVQTTGRGVKPV